jgi:hypothetical protein
MPLYLQMGCTLKLSKWQLTTYGMWSPTKIHADESLSVDLVGPSKLRFFSQWTSLIGPSQTSSKTLDTSQNSSMPFKCKNKWKYQYLANDIGSKRTTMGKAYGTMGGAIGNMLRKIIWLHEHLISIKLIVTIFGQGHYPFLKVCIPTYMACSKN